MSTTKIPLYIKVDRYVKEFIISTYGSDVVDIGQQDALFERIKYMLQLQPKDYKKPIKGDNTITVFIPYFKILDKHIDKIYRANLDDRRQALIASEFKKLLKRSMHNYIAGYCRSNLHKDLDENQKAGIEDFCEFYRINMDKILHESLKKSWDRSKEKKNLKRLENIKKLYA